MARTAGAYAINGVSYPSQYAYRKALAENKGYASVRAFHTDRAAEVAISRLSRGEQAARLRALEAISRMRAGDTLGEAARSAHTTPQSVRKYAGTALSKSGGRTVARETDTLLRPLWVPFPDGVQVVDIRSSADATTLSRYWAAIENYRRTGDLSVMRPFEGKQITARGQKVTLPTDRQTLERLEMAGELDIEDLYSRDMRG